MQPHVPDGDLAPEDVPARDAPWEDIVAFGHRYHAYKVAGSLQRVAALTLEAHTAWEQDASLPSSLARLRLALFHTVRATHGTAASPETERWARALVAAIASHVRHHARPDDASPPRADVPR